MLFTLTANPIAPLMLVALVLAGLALIWVIAYIFFLNRRYPTAEARRKLRRAEIAPGKLIAGAALIFLVLGLAIASTVGDMLNYSQNVKQVQAVARNGGITLSEAQAELLLGNAHGYIYKPIVADGDGTVGSANVDGRPVRIVQVEGLQYILLTGDLAGR